MTFLKYNRLITNIILKNEKLKAFPLKYGKMIRCPLSPCLFNTVLKVLVTAVGQEESIKHNQTGRER